MKVFVDTAIVQRVIEERFGGLHNFVDDWADRKFSKIAKPRMSRDDKTIYAWLKNGLPAQRDTIFGFFGMLGVDPVAVIDLERSGLPARFGLLRAAMMFGGGAGAGGFAPLFDIYRPAVDWPDGGLADIYFGRGWTTREFVHDANAVSNQYVTVTIQPDEGRAAWHPCAFHVAYRRKSNADGLWRPFGTIINRAGTAILIHENGNIQRAALQPSSGGAVSFKTYFGPGAAEFRLASLDTFDCKLALVDDPSVHLRFDG